MPSTIEDTFDDAALEGRSDCRVERNPEILRRRAKLCREKASETPHPRLAEAFIELAEALEFAAALSDVFDRRVLH